MSQKPIYVTQPHLPPFEDFLPYLKEVWDSKFLTNGGPMHQKFERALCEYLGVNQVALFSNGTLALLTALQSLRITGEVITTPYSFVATAHSLLWNGVRPVFVDVDPDTLNLDPGKIEAAITPQTTAIMPVHCYGHPCDVDRIEKIEDVVKPGDMLKAEVISLDRDARKKGRIVEAVTAEGVARGNLRAQARQLLGSGYQLYLSVERCVQRGLELDVAQPQCQ